VKRASRTEFLEKETQIMKRLVITASILCLSAIGMMGCAEKESTESELKLTTPGGETTITTEREVKQTGENPPPVRP
jgi:hypothetical protein